MSDPRFVVVVTGLKDLEKYKGLPERIASDMAKAVNATATWARTDAGRRIREQVDFGAAYLSESQGRLTVAQRATQGNPIAIVRGQQRPTSLARFARETVPNKKGGLHVEVQPGFSRFMPGAFLVKLNAGKGRTETKFNLGLAVRLKPGHHIGKKTHLVSLGKGLYLLYAPSVDQVFRDVSKDLSQEAADRLRDEFLRLQELN